MRAVLLSAGRGSRLLPLTETMPKCLVEVDGRTILGHQLSALAANGIEEAVVVGGYRCEQIAAHLAAHRYGLGVEVRFNPFWAVASSISSVWAARDVCAGPFVLMNGDTIFDPAVLAQGIGQARPGINLLVEALGVPEDDDMRVRVSGGSVRALSKRLAEATHRSLGVIVSPDADGGGYGEALAAVIAQPNGINAYHHAILDWLARRGEVHAIERRGGAWQEIDRTADIDRWELQTGPR